jgi:hypothetical protein
MSVTTHHCEQGTPEWYALRLGLPTMSRANAIQAKRKDGASLTRQRYLHELAAERITGRLTEGFTTVHMERGKALEAGVRETYAFVYEVEQQLVGFCHDEEKGCGCSPDALIDASGMLEIKTTLPYLQVELLASNRPPPEHKAQVQGGLWLLEREWCDLAIYSEGLTLYIDRAYRDEAYIKSLATEVTRFTEELENAVERVRQYGTPLLDRLRAIL